MVQGVERILELSPQFGTAQIPVELTTPEDIAFSFSGSQGFLVLISGIVLALAFQLLLTNFFIALGISYSDTGDQSSSDRTGSLNDQITKVGTVVGLRTLGTITITLFGACFLAVKLCLSRDPVLGAILGLVIWAAYFSLLLWVSSTTVSSVIGTVVNTATSGLQGIVGTALVAFGAKNASQEVVTTAEAAATAVRRDLSSAVDSVSARKAIDNYLKKLELPEEDRQEIQAEFGRLVADPKMKSLAKDNHFHNIGRQSFVDIVSSRTEFSKQEVDQAVNQFEMFWQQLWGQQQKSTANGFVETLNGTLKSAPLPELESAQVTAKLDQLIEETRQRQAQQQAVATQKMAETAAWWLFGTAFFSAAASAIAGAISVRG